MHTFYYASASTSICQSVLTLFSFLQNENGKHWIRSVYIWFFYAIGPNKKQTEFNSTNTEGFFLSFSSFRVSVCVQPDFVFPWMSFSVLDSNRKSLLVNAIFHNMMTLQTNQMTQSVFYYYQWHFEAKQKKKTQKRKVNHMIVSSSSRY